MLSAWGVMRPTKNVLKAGMDRGLFAVLFDAEQGNIYVREAAGMIKEWRMGRLMRMRVAKDHGLRSWVRSIDRAECGVGCAVSCGQKKSRKA